MQRPGTVLQVPALLYDSLFGKRAAILTNLHAGIALSLVDLHGDVGQLTEIAEQRLVVRRVLGLVGHQRQNGAAVPGAQLPYVDIGHAVVCFDFDLPLNRGDDFLFDVFVQQDPAGFLQQAI
jgi:hypothetical protein